MKVEGIGLLTGARLIASFQRGDFRNADAFIAFLGLDLRISQSGRKKGRSCLTKRGDPEVRRLLHNAAMSARRTERWKGVYEALLARGLSTTRSEEHTSELQSLMRISYAVFCLKKKKQTHKSTHTVRKHK